jgi:Actin interacting protein 3
MKVLYLIKLANIESRMSLAVPQRVVSSEPRTGGMSPEKIPVFLQLGTAVRKTLVSVTEMSIQSLRLLFVEKFQFNPGSEAFPDILITDRETGVKYSLEENSQDIVEGTMLTLDIEGLFF